MKSIFLSDPSRDILLKYRFPGNIRQLKNLVEQMSILEAEKEITPEILMKYIPQAQEGRELPALYIGKREDGMTERDILYKVLFEMRRDVTELKKLVANLLKEEKIDRSLVEDPSMFDNLVTEEMPEKTDEKEPILLNPTLEDREPYTSDDIEDIIHEAQVEDESLSIEHKEKELILKALKKNHNKRKYAARDLGISERTLYRKIKQYEIEE
jgi:DNA-binding NtrC family response regulator